MHYIEISTIENDRFYVEGDSHDDIRALFWQLVNDVNEKKVLAMALKASGKMMVIRTSDIKQALEIEEDELPLTRKPIFITLLSQGD